VGHPLDGAQLKFDRACEHVDCLHAQVRAFLNKEHTQRVLDEFQPQTGGYVRQIIDRAPTPPGWSILIGEIAYNFNSCLDHIAWQFAVAFSPTDNVEDGWNDTRAVSFPLFSDRRKYLGQLSSAWRHKGLLPQHRRLVRNAQPYQRRDAPETHSLWHLLCLSNIDKHQVLHTTLVALAGDIGATGMFVQYRDPITGELRGSALRPPAVPFTRASFTLLGPGAGDVKFEGDFPIEIEIEQPGTILHEQSMLGLVDGIRAEVGAVLANAKPLL
jgi:hypothetical protein